MILLKHYYKDDIQQMTMKMSLYSLFNSNRLDLLMSNLRTNSSSRIEK